MDRLWLLVLKVSVAVVAAVVVAALALRTVGAWAPPRPLLVVLVVASALLSAGSTSAAAVQEWRTRRLGARRERAEQLLTAAAWAVADATGLDYRDLGAAAYRLERPGLLRLVGAGRRERLRRVHRLRPRHRLGASGIDWRPGVGVVGSCVAMRQVVAQDLDAVYRALLPCTREEWETLVPEAVRQGLTYDEFVDVRDKYAVVVATPVVDDSSPVPRVVGCLSLDGPAGSFESLTSPEVLAVLDSAAQALLGHAARVPG
ncbi:hypothetical protein [Motilibacter deserti]|uniref:DNA-binding IclR family transcriptional regulator n=1 Tax=Motilibacter deserti TaxID=2714956 RepID=A0ABX0GTF5_9ACTN|nr:hypothetical protein [Motilibacter deserti]NHC14188.1 hypothetical protein [Motilibacter deserti]